LQTGHELCELWAIGPGTADLLEIDRLGTGCFQGGELGIELLICGTDAGVSFPAKTLNLRNEIADWSW
jgi:hypothetical protein